MVGHKKNHNIAFIKDEAIVMVCAISSMTLNCPDHLIENIDKVEAT